MSKEAAERSDDAAAPSPRHTLAGRVTAVCHGGAIEDDENLAPIRCRL